MGFCMTLGCRKEPLTAELLIGLLRPSVLASEGAGCSMCCCTSTSKVLQLHLLLLLSLLAVCAGQAW